MAGPAGGRPEPGQPAGPADRAGRTGRTGRRLGWPGDPARAGGPEPAPPGDPGGFAAWVRPHLPAMARLAARLAAAADRDDVVQEALVRAWTKRRLSTPAAAPRPPGCWPSPPTRPARPAAGPPPRAGSSRLEPPRRAGPGPGPGPRRGHAVRPAAAGRRLLLLRGSHRRRDGGVMAARRARSSPPSPTPGPASARSWRSRRDRPPTRCRPAARRAARRRRRPLAGRPARPARAGPRAARPPAPARWQPLAAAAAVVASPPAGSPAWRSPAAASPPPPAGRVAGQTAAPGDAVVRDGDRVAGQGTVIARRRPAGRSLCAGRRPDLRPHPPSARLRRSACTVTGLDLDRLSDRDERDGVVWGGAWVEAVYRAGTLAVTRQEPYRQPPPPDVTAPDHVPCPEPAGGWPRQPANPTAIAVAAQPAPWPRAPDRVHRPVRPVPVRLAPAGHLRTARAPRSTSSAPPATWPRPAGDLAKVFPARHLCVIRAEWSRAAMAAAERTLRTPAAVAAGIGRPFPDVAARPGQREPGRAGRAGRPLPGRGGRRPGGARADAGEGRAIRPRSRWARSSAAAGSGRTPTARRPAAPPGPGGAARSRPPR